MMDSKVVHIRLNKKDLRIVETLKDVYGYDEIAPLFRYIIRRDLERKIEEMRAREPPREYSSQSTAENLGG
jgi:hypothetical protein